MTTVPTMDERAAANAAAGPRRPQPTEVGGVIGFFLLCSWVLYRLVLVMRADQIVVATVAVLAGYVASDLVSGLVHWLFDTWGSPETRVVGASFIVPFRIHHVDPKDITRHGFIATNGHNCLVSIPVLAAALLLTRGSSWAATPALAFVLSLCLGVFATNQFHKWAHEDHVAAPIRWLQQARLILGPTHHDVHHASPFAENYCITSGWLNRPLRAISFFRALERAITATTRGIPRRDDLAASSPKSI